MLFYSIKKVELSNCMQLIQIHTIYLPILLLIKMEEIMVMENETWTLEVEAKEEMKVFLAEAMAINLFAKFVVNKGT